MSEEKKVVIKKLKSAAVTGKFMADYYYELDAAAKTGEKKIAWCTSVGPAEILRALGFLVYFPETHSAMLGATRMATDLIPKANAIGYSPDICSYLTADVGAYIDGVSPLAKVYKGIEGPPHPDVLVFNTNQCRDVQDWFKYYGKEYNVPVVGVHSYVGVEEVGTSYLLSIARQMEELVPPLEQVSGTKFDMDRLRQAVSLSRECSDLWKKVLDTAAASPLPHHFFLTERPSWGRQWWAAAPSGPTTPTKFCWDELEGRVAAGEGALENEKYRIYWDGMPVWGRLSVQCQDVCRARCQCAGVDLLQQLDIFRPGPG